VRQTFPKTSQTNQDGGKAARKRPKHLPAGWWSFREGRLDHLNRLFFADLSNAFLTQLLCLYNGRWLYWRQLSGNTL